MTRLLGSEECRLRRLHPPHPRVHPAKASQNSIFRSANFTSLIRVCLKHKGIKHGIFHTTYPLVHLKRGADPILFYRFPGKPLPSPVILQAQVRFRVRPGTFNDLFVCKIDLIQGAFYQGKPKAILWEMMGKTPFSSKYSKYFPPSTR